MSNVFYDSLAGHKLNSFSLLKSIAYDQGITSQCGFTRRMSTPLKNLISILMIRKFNYYSNFQYILLN